LSKGGTLEELEKIFIKCQQLEAIDIEGRIKYEYTNKLLDLLVVSAPLTLCKIHIYYTSMCFNNESIQLFLTNWSHCKGKKTLHLYSLTRYLISGVHQFIHKDFWNFFVTWPYEYDPRY
jgi:hypothetical protein